MVRKVMQDDNAPRLTRELFAQMRPMKEVTPDAVEALKAARGRPRVAAPKQVVSIRLEREAHVAWVKLTREQRERLIGTLSKGAIRSYAAMRPSRKKARSA
jgi:uncharacterized protein (DUF4415 family)